MATEHYDKAVILYPAYMDAEKTCRQGRRVPKPSAVERPDSREMYDVVTKGLNLQAQHEQKKTYSRDALNPGRIKVIIKDDSGNLCDISIPNKQVLLVKCAELCAKHVDRPKRIEDLKRFEQQLCSSRATGGPAGKASASTKGSSAAASASTASSSKTSSKSNKKKGKKK